MSELTRESYIESEYAKWINQYEIGFEQEFEVKALLSLQYQFLATPNEHVKTLGDIIHTTNQIKRNLNLKTKINQDKQIKILVKVDDYGKKDEMYNLFYSLLQHHTITHNNYRSKIVTKDFEVKIENNSDAIRGTRADYFIDVSNKNIKELDGKPNN